MSNGSTVPTVVVQPCWVDSSGNIKVNGRSAITLLLTWELPDGTPIDVSANLFTFEVEDVLKTDLLPAPGVPSQQSLFLDQDAVALIGVSPNPKYGPPFVVRDETKGDDDGVVIWEGMIIVRGFTDEPPPVTIVEPARV
jgi:hypothetical protein